MNRTLLVCTALFSCTFFLTACQPIRQSKIMNEDAQPSPMIDADSDKQDQEQTYPIASNQPLPSSSLPPASSLQTTVTTKTNNDELLKVLDNIDSDMATNTPTSTELNDL